MKKIICATILATVLVFTALAQIGKDENIVRAIPDKLFAEMAAANPEGITALFLPDAQLFALIAQKDGNPRTQIFTAETFSKMFQDKTRSIKEVMHNTKVEVDGNWGTVSGRYVFFADKKISHCGINQFNLFRTENGWKISNATTTIDPGSCTEAEKAMKAEPLK